MLRCVRVCAVRGGRLSVAFVLPPAVLLLYPRDEYVLTLGRQADRPGDSSCTHASNARSQSIRCGRPIQRKGLSWGWGIGATHMLLFLFVGRFCSYVALFGEAGWNAAGASNPLSHSPQHVPGGDAHGETWSRKHARGSCEACGHWLAHLGGAWPSQSRVCARCVAPLLIAPRGPPSSFFSLSAWQACHKKRMHMWYFQMRCRGPRRKFRIF